MSHFIKVGFRWGVTPSHKDLAFKNSIFLISNEYKSIFSQSDVIQPEPLLLVKNRVYALADGNDIIALAIAKSEYAIAFSEWDKTGEVRDEFEKLQVTTNSAWVVDVLIYNLNSKINYGRTPGACKINNSRVIEQLELVWNEIANNSIESSIKKNNKFNHPLNQILYGPPGTGKTYLTKAVALSIVNNESVEVLNKEENRTTLTKEFDKLLEDGRVQFCTFHQSMSYEDFVEGIKPETNNGGIVYNIKKGILGEFSRKAQFYTSDEVFSKWNDIFRKASTNSTFWKIDPLDDHYMIDIFLKENFIALNSFPSLDISEINSEEEYEENFKSLGSDSQNPRRGLALYLRYFKLTLKNEEIIFLCKGNKQIIAIGKVIGDYYYLPNEKYPHRRDVQWLVKDFEKPVSDFYSIRFNQNFCAIYKSKLKTYNQIRLKDDKDNLKPHILIIDEINRGNIAAIFGELITLLEESKRQGASDETWVTLTYSGEKFCLPPNLYIIGTMNTADRSVEALDTALRRRFSFIEMPPKPEILSSDIEGVDVRQLLKVINQRITALKDADHTIGHAWFIDCKTKQDVLAVMVDKVVPLLREHFYNENEKLEAVIGEQFFDSPQTDIKFLGNWKGEKVNLIKHLISRDVMLTKGIDLKLLYEVNS